MDTRPEGGANKLSWAGPLAINDNQRSSRMFAQSGWFTIHGTNIAAIEDIYPNRKDMLIKLEIPKPAITAAKEFLILAGIGHRQLFPDLDGLARSITDTYKLGQ